MKKIWLWSGILLVLSTTALTTAGTLQYNNDSVQNCKPLVKKVYHVQKSVKNSGVGGVMTLKVNGFAQAHVVPTGTPKKPRIAAIRQGVSLFAYSCQRAEKPAAVMPPVYAAAASAVRANLHLSVDQSAGSGRAADCVVNAEEMAASVSGFFAGQAAPAADLAPARSVEYASAAFTGAFALGSALCPAGFFSPVRLLALDRMDPLGKGANDKTASAVLPITSQKPALPAANPSTVPEPSCFAMMLCGAAAMGAFLRRRK